MKKRLNTKLVAMLTAFLMVFAMMPLVAFGEETPDGEIPADDPAYVETPETGGDNVDNVDADTVAGTDSVDVPEEDYVVKEEQPAAFEAKGETHVHNNVSFDPWGDNDKLPDTSGSYYLTKDVTIGSTWEVPSGTTSLCLNGHGIRFAGETGSVIFINGGNTLNLCDCNSANLTHKYTVTNGLATVDDNATGEDVKTFSGGFITGGNCTISNNKNGGGIFISGILNMSGGTIIGNQADHSAGVENRGTFNMSGNALVEYNKAGATGGVGNRLNYKFTMSGNATIRHNTSKSNGYGGGVTNYGDFYVSGTPVISENTMGNGVNGNVYAGRTGDYYFPIRVMGKLESGASIGVKRYDNTKGIIAVPGESYTITDSDKARFTADDARYEVNLISGGENDGKLELKDKEYDLWVGGTRVTSANCQNIPAAEGYEEYSGKASYDADSNTLTLDNYTYTGEGMGTRGIFDSNDEQSKLTIKLKGTNTITVSKDSYAYNESRTCEGIQVYRPLEIKGGDTDRLNIHAKGATNNNDQLKGIVVVFGDLTISGGIVNAVAYACQYHSRGVQVQAGNAYINGGTLIAKGNSIDWSEGTSSGIETSKLHISKDAKEVTAIGAKKAIIGTVKNEMPGKGWTDDEGTGEGTLIEKYSGTGDGYDFNKQPYSDYHKVRFEPVHEHSFTYAVGDNPNTITAKCEGDLDCPEGYNDNPFTITLNKPTDLTYDAAAKAATLTGNYPDTAVTGLAEKPTIVYYKSIGENSTTADGDQLSGSPVNAGNYVAKVTWGDTTSSATVSVAFSIAKAPLKITAKDQTYEYNGQTQGIGDTVYDSEFDKYVTCEGLKGSDALTSIVLFCQAKDIGVYEGEQGVTVRSATVNNLNEAAGNYAITYVPGKLIIKGKDTSNVSGAPITSMTAGKDSMTITWEKTEGVDGYDIFFSRCNHGNTKVEMQNVKTISGNNTFVWTNSGLKAGTSYKAYVKAYIMTSSGKKYVKSSPLMHAYTGKGTKKYTNAKSVKVNKANVSVNVGKTFKIKAKVKKLKKNKKLMPKKHVAKVRYLSTDTSIATVSSKGKIKGVKKGTCYVYAYAHNGVFKKITVTVK